MFVGKACKPLIVVFYDNVADPYYDKCAIMVSLNTEALNLFFINTPEIKTPSLNNIVE